MKILSTIKSNTSLPTTTTRYTTRDYGFSKMLSEVISAADEKEARMNQARQEQPAYSVSDINESIVTANQMKATLSAQSYLSPSMLGLYKAQENKNEKPVKTPRFTVI